MMALLTHAVSFIPVIGPIAAMVLGGVAALWAPARAAAVNVGSGALSLARTLLATPGAVQVLLGVLIAVLVVLLVLLLGQVNAAKAALIDPATKTTWQAEAKASALALTSARASQASLTAANARQGASIQALHDAGQVTLAKSAVVASGLTSAGPAIARRASAVTAADQGPSVCDRVLNVDAAFAGGL